MSSGRIGYGHDTERDDSPVIELSVTELRHLLAGVERALFGFLAAATDWISEHLPDHSVPLTVALARALALPAPGTPPTPLGRDRT